MIRNELMKRHALWVDKRKATLNNRILNMQDDRIHLCLYFISSHRLKEIDVVFIKQLTDLVPIIPIVAKSDTMTTAERKVHLLEIKKRLHEIDLELRENVTMRLEQDWSEDEYRLYTSTFDRPVHVEVVEPGMNPTALFHSSISDTNCTGGQTIHAHSVTYVGLDDSGGRVALSRASSSSENLSSYSSDDAPEPTLHIYDDAVEDGKSEFFVIPEQCALPQRWDFNSLDIIGDFMFSEYSQGNTSIYYQQNDEAIDKYSNNMN